MGDFPVYRRKYLIISAVAGAATSVTRPAAAETGDGDDDDATEPDRALTITVVDEDGDPVENANVSVVTSDGGKEVESVETDSDDDDDVVAGYPTIQQFDLSDTSPPNPNVSLAVEWSVAHENAALSSVYVEARSDRGRTVGTATTDVSGSMASGTDLFTIDHATGDTFIVSLFVTDTADNTTTEYDRLDSSWRSSMQSD